MFCAKLILLLVEESPAASSREAAYDGTHKHPTGERVLADGIDGPFQAAPFAAMFQFGHSNFVPFVDIFANIGTNFVFLSPNITHWRCGPLQLGA